MSPRKSPFFELRSGAVDTLLFVVKTTNLDEMRAELTRRFEATLAKDPTFFHARAQIAVYRYEADGNLDAAIKTLEEVVTAAKFQNVSALVTLAMFQMQRDGASAEAKLNLQRALAIDDAYMPAYNQLALWHLVAWGF